ncbi:MAG: glutamine-hydrolyzing carbamoyl-phosphate synthase small subunit [Candidatus Woesearchaeota archaeon]
MSFNIFKKAKLILEDGSSFEGFSFAAEKNVSGEVVFNTGMIGYPESLTDPSYEGQILVLTYPLIGNYGVPGNDYDELGFLKNFESNRIYIKGLVVSDYSKEFSHWRSEKSLSDWLLEHNIPAICGVDTRAVTKRLRERGVMLGKLVYENVHEDDVPFENPNNMNLVAEVSVKRVETYGSGEKKVILLDCGAKYNIIRSLVLRGIKVMRVPWNYDISSLDYDGVFVSNGPGDPKMCVTTIESLRQAMKKKVPIMGICLGNQLLALAAGANTYKLKYGHRSQNQPCIDVKTGRCYITSQNHGYAVDKETLPSGWEEWFVNANDGTNEGIRHASLPFCGVQFHPEATPGPVDTAFLFDKFREMINV